MKAVGVIVEYNPFHNGHKFHVEQSKQLNDAEVAIAVMSGSFLQRGEPALVSKWSRAAMALQGGVDLVIELPYIYSTQHAEYFANGSVAILEALHCESFCFGSENGTIESFISANKMMANNKEALDEQIQIFSKQGNSYPKSVSLAIQSLNLQSEKELDLSKPNNILGFQYVKAALTNNYRIRPALINRVGAQYHDIHLPTGQIASATSIRKALLHRNQKDDIAKSFVPPYTYQELQSYIQKNHILHHWEQYWSLLKYKLLSTSAADLADIYEVEEGIQYRLKDAAQYAETFDEFIMKVKTKRYTLTRLQRICVHVLTGAKKDTMKQLVHKPAYLRILGFTDKGQKYLNTKKKQLELPLVSRVSAFEHEALSLDVQASTIHSLVLPQKEQSKAIQREYQQPIIMKSP